MKRIGIVILILSVCFVPSASAQKTITCPSSVNWTDFHTTDMARYNPCETVLGVDNVGSLDLKWTFGAGAQVGGSPAVVNGVVYFGSDDGSVYAVKASNGGLLWRYPTGGGESSPAVANGVVYVGSWNGNVYALRAATGATLWSYPTGGAVEDSPVETNGVVYVGSMDDNLYALNANSGAKLWNYTTGAGIYGSPALANGVVYVGSQDNTGYALAPAPALSWGVTQLEALSMILLPWRMG